MSTASSQATAGVPFHRGEDSYRAPSKSDADHADVRSREPLLPRRITRLVLGVALLALLLRLALAARPLTFLDRLFVPDDTYYTLSIAHSLAAGLGPSVDGGATLTTGFQPLIAFLTVPVFWLTDEPGLPLRAVLVMLAFADAITVVLLARLAFRVAGPAAAVTAAVLWAVSPYALEIAMGGLEASLSVMVSVALVELWCIARQSSGIRLWVLVGVLAGVALLTRVDTVFLIVLLGLVELAGRHLKRTLITAAAAFVVVLPWWVVSIAIAGTPVPQSGAAVQELVAFHRAQGLDIPQTFGFAAGRLLGAPVHDFPALRTFLVSHPTWALGTSVALCTVLVAAGAWWGLCTRSAVRGRASSLPLLALALHAVSLIVFYAVINAAPWFYDRYLLPVVAVITLVIATVVGALWRACAHRSSLVALSHGARGVLALAVVSLVALETAGSVGLLRIEPEGSTDGGLEGAKGYAEVAQAVLSQLPQDAVLGSMQSGALGYFAEYGPRQVRVVNLDGVVNVEAAKALADHRLADYARSAGVTHFADWPGLYFVFLSRSDAGTVTSPRLVEIGRARPQGAEAYLVWKISFEPGP